MQDFLAKLPQNLRPRGPVEHAIDKLTTNPARTGKRRRRKILPPAIVPKVARLGVLRRPTG